MVNLIGISLVAMLFIYMAVRAKQSVIPLGEVMQGYLTPTVSDFYSPRMLYYSNIRKENALHEEAHKMYYSGREMDIRQGMLTLEKKEMGIDFKNQILSLDKIEYGLLQREDELILGQAKLSLQEQQLKLNNDREKIAIENKRESLELDIKKHDIFSTQRMFEINNADEKKRLSLRKEYIQLKEERFRVNKKEDRLKIQQLTLENDKKAIGVQHLLNTGKTMLTENRLAERSLDIRKREIKQFEQDMQYVLKELKGDIIEHKNELSRLKYETEALENYQRQISSA